ncbi:methylenetetrahydrofolate reductase C-terminal domain-containing protein [Chloroflexota bacterium]
MIVGERKPFEEIKESIKDYKKVLIMGCGTCVAVCMAGGEKEVELLASQLRMANEIEGREMEIGEMTIQRQCDREYFDPIIEKATTYDAILSMACGAGVQFLADLVEPVPIIPALNTRFIGVTENEGHWSERCRACGDCKLGLYAGVCPVTMCAKSLLNGPCGGASHGKCEAQNDNDCAWEIMYRRLKAQGKLDNLKKFSNAHNHKLEVHPGHVASEENAAVSSS